MADLISFKQAQRLAKKKKSKNMCRHGFHKWVVCQHKQFDVKQGKLVTIFRCERCQAEKVKNL